MTIRHPARGWSRARRLASLAWPLALLAGCATPLFPDRTPTAAAPTVAAVAPAPLEVAASAVPKALDQAAASGVAAAVAAEPQVVAPPLEDPLRPNVRLDMDERAARVDLWARLRRGFAMPDLGNDLVRDRERWYASRPDYVARMTDRGGRYLFHIVEELDKRGMPTELALLPFIESAFNPQAMSVAKASGMWQFIPSTGRDFELTQNVFRDDRRDVLESTRAALDYLSKLHGMFGDWHLALAAYNWGEGSVQRAMAKNRKAGLATDYESLRMPDETRLYLPKLQAVKNIVARPEAFGIVLPELYNHPYFLSVPIERDMDVAVAIRLAGMTVEEFQSLNPQMNRPLILAEGTPRILLPYDNANRFVRELPRHRGPLASWTAWTAPRTMKPGDVARENGMSEEQLREVNRIPERMLITAGSTLLVPRGNALLANVSGHIADTAQISFAPDAPPLRRVVVRAGRQDNVASLARRYRVSATRVAEWNRVAPGARLARGQTVIVYVPVAGRKVARGAPPRATRSAAAPAARSHRSAGVRAKPSPRVAAATAKAGITKAKNGAAARPRARLAAN